MDPQYVNLYTKNWVCSEIILCFFIVTLFPPNQPPSKGLAFFQPRPSPPKSFVPPHSSLSSSPTSNTTRKINKKPCFRQNIPCSPLNPPYLLQFFSDLDESSTAGFVLKIRSDQYKKVDESQKFEF